MGKIWRALIIAYQTPGLSWEESVYILKRVRKVRWLGLRVRVVLEGAGQF